MAFERIKHAWNAFRSRDPTGDQRRYEIGPSYGVRPDQVRLSRGHERTIINSILTRIALDAASIDVKHIRTDDQDRYLEDIPSGLNNCFQVEANIDQTGRAFLQDVFMTMLDEGCVAVVPTDLDDEPTDTGSLAIACLRVGTVKEWWPQDVRVRVYNELKGEKDEVNLPKRMVSIVQNPMYSIMNEPNSTMQRLARKLSLLDSVDEKTTSGRLDLILQLPYVVKNETRKMQAEARRKAIEKQLSEGTYGIAYTDGTERITQLNRPVENNLMKQIEYLTSMLFSQLGITQSILDGTADESTMLNYFNRTVEPMLSALTLEMTRKFLSKTARSQHQAIRFFRDPFRLVPLNQLAELVDKLTRNAVTTSNEMRQIIGLKPSSDPDADVLRNKNLPKADEPEDPPNNPEQETSGKITKLPVTKGRASPNVRAAPKNSS